MPEPDFDQIAQRLARIGTLPPQATAQLHVDVVEQLRQIWNARGAADLEKVDANLSWMQVLTAAAPSVTTLKRELQSLDR